MHFDVLTLFPEMFSGYLGQSLLKKAIDRGLVQVRLHDIRDWARGRHKQVDDRPFGGGPGMVIKVEPVVECVEAVRREDEAGRATAVERCGKARAEPGERDGAEPGETDGDESGEAARAEQSDEKGGGGQLILLTPQGQRLTQPLVEQLATRRRLVLLCGRYEGFDQRVVDILQPEEISIGDYVLNGGEVAAMVLIDAVTRLVPGVLGDEDSSQQDSFSDANRWLEFAQYTRPREYRGHEVPEVLLSGDHQAIARWRREQSYLKTKQRRADLLERAADNVEEQASEGLER